jgi:iron complex outermembrane receptor protein
MLRLHNLMRLRSLSLLSLPFPLASYPYDTDGEYPPYSDNEQGDDKLKLNNFVRAYLVSIWLLAVLSLGALTAQAASARFEIEPQDLSGALKAFAVQSHREIFFAPELARGRKSNGVKGTFDDLKALNMILEGTGLDFLVTSSNAILVRDPASKSESSRLAPTTSANDDPTDAPIRMTQAASAQTQNFETANGASSTPAVPSGSDKSALTEIVVTAQKKSERLQDVPVPVTALSADALVDSNELRLQDYYTQVPGLNVTPGGLDNAPALSIRGITTGVYTNPTVATLVDDVPYGSTTNLGGGALVPDIDPSDLARVEVLRGPQGTLYGASSIGGLLKFVTLDPSTDGVSGKIQASTSGVYNGVDPGYGFRGSINVPLSDTLAVRASAFARRDPGYIDNVETGERGVNWGDASGGRLAALWRPSDVISLKVSALAQDENRNGSPNVTVPPGGDLQQSALPNTGAYDRKTQAYSATLTAKLGPVNLTSLTGYSVDRLFDSIDYTPLLGQYTYPVFGVTGTPLIDQTKTSKVTQEVRLTSAIGKAFDWLFGVFYTHERSPLLSQYLAEEASTGRILDNSASSFNWAVTYAEVAAFTDLTFHITDQFDIQFGARESQNKQSYSEIDSGPLIDVFDGLPSPVIFPKVDTKDNSFTYLVTPQYRLSSDLMIYARVATGYRPGGPNPSAIAFGLPLSYRPDTTQNYEIGAKGDLFGHSLTYDLSLYHIDWKDIQLSVNTPLGLSYIANGSRAKSQGVEFSVESKPLDGLTLSAWVAWNDAVLTENLPVNSSVIGLAGDRLPNSSRLSGNLSLKHDFPIANRVTGFVGAALSYVGDRESYFPSIYSGPQRQNLPAYARTDLRAGAKYGPWTADLFVTNVADKRGLLTGGTGAPLPYAFDYIQPRTIGISLSRSF